MKKAFFSIAAFVLCTASFAQGAFSPRDAQRAGQEFSARGLSDFKNPNTLVQKGKSSEGLGGSEYSETPPENLTGQKNKGSLLTIGNDSRASSVSKVNNQGGYSNDRNNQADEAVHFLNKKPVLKPSFSPNDPMLNADTFSMGTSPFASSIDKECKQVIDEKADLKNIEACVQTYSPYIYTCQTSTKVSFTRQNYCPPGRRLERIIRNLCPGCTDPFIVLDVFCGQQEGTYQVSSWTSTCSSGDCLYQRMFTNRVVPATVGATQDIYFGNFGSGCNFPLHYRQTCSATHCDTAYSLRNSTCNGRDFSAPGRYEIPWRDIMSEAAVNDCTAAEQLGK
jgi:hypothetical protein